MLDSLVKPALKKPHRRQLSEVFAHANGLVIQMEEFHLLCIRGGAQDEPDWRLLSRGPLVFVEPAKIELHLPRVPRLEALKLQFDGHQPSQKTMVEEQVETLHLAQDCSLDIPLAIGALQPQEVEEVGVGTRLPGSPGRREAARSPR